MQIKATIIADSLSLMGKRLTTFELIYPRLIHSEIMTHKMLAKNAASSRAIPVSKVIDMVRNTPAMPTRFGANQGGMQDKGVEHDGVVELYSYQAGNWQSEMSGREAWVVAANAAADLSEALDTAGYHKQVCNRITEPFQWMKTVMTGTEYANFFWLRDHKDADPTLREVAIAMHKAYSESTPTPLEPGEWHLPYYEQGYWKVDIFKSLGFDGITDSHGITLEDALDISMSCCAQVSYRTLDDSLEKAKRVVERLNLGESDDPKHSSPAEHQGTPIRTTEIHDNSISGMSNHPAFVDSWEEGITAYHKELGFMSGNLAGFIQKRQLIKGNTKW